MASLEVKILYDVIQKTRKIFAMKGKTDSKIKGFRGCGKFYQQVSKMQFNKNNEGFLFGNFRV